MTHGSDVPCSDTATTLPKLFKHNAEAAVMRRGERRRSTQRPPSTLYAPSQSLMASWSYMDAEGNRRSVFNSLPRSFYQSLPRRARLNSFIGGDKRNTDMSTILLQKTSFPPPACCHSLHDNGFHEVCGSLDSGIAYNMFI